MGLFIGLQTVKSRQTYSAIALTLDAAGNTVSWGPLGTIDDIGDNRAIYDAANSDGASLSRWCTTRADSISG